MFINHIGELLLQEENSKKTFLEKLEKLASNFFANNLLKNGSNRKYTLNEHEKA